MSISRIQLLALAVMPAFASTTARGADERGDTPVLETIYNFRTERVSRTVGPTAFCQGLGWQFLLYEDVFDAFSYATRGADGRVVNTERQKIGTLRACIAFKSSPPLVLNFYGELDIGDLHVTGLGVCTQQFADFPVPGSSFYTCNQSLTSAGYVGGHLVTSTTTGPLPIEESDPNLFGIHETSFATVRLWRERR